MKKKLTFMAAVIVFATLLLSCNKDNDEFIETTVKKTNDTTTVVGIKKDEIEEPVVL